MVASEQKVKQQLLINADHLAGVHMAIALHAPKHMRRLELFFLREPVTTGVSPRQGESPSAKYAFAISLEDANAVLEALREIERREGSNAKFRGFQINLLVAIWSECARSLAPWPAESPFQRFLIKCGFLAAPSPSR
jgi:hypothetical protein